MMKQLDKIAHTDSNDKVFNSTVETVGPNSMAANQSDMLIDPYTTNVEVVKDID